MLNTSDVWLEPGEIYDVEVELVSFPAAVPANNASLASFYVDFTIYRQDFSMNDVRDFWDSIQSLYIRKTVLSTAVSWDDRSATERLRTDIGFSEAPVEYDGYVNALGESVNHHGSSAALSSSCPTPCKSLGEQSPVQSARESMDPVERHQFPTVNVTPNYLHFLGIQPIYATTIAFFIVALSCIDLYIYCRIK